MEERIMKTVEEYLKELDYQLKNSDKATRRDALADAEDHLRSALWESKEAQPEKDEEILLASLIEEYGTPEETALAYMDMEKRLITGNNQSLSNQRNGFIRFLSVVSDSRAWSSLLYGLLALPMGIIYFTWAVTGFSLSLSLMVLIFGIPLAVLFFLSFHGLAFIEGRLVETLLGERMPRRKVFIDSNQRWGDRLKRLFFQADSWLILLYLIIMLPLGILYFTLNITFFATSLGLFASPIVLGILNEPFFVSGTREIWHNGWTTAGSFIVGILLFLISLHMAKGLGYLQGKLAKAMLVRE
jgi:uncharacterized membrane protein